MKALINLHPLLSPASPTSPASPRLVVLLVQCHAHGYHQRDVYAWGYRYVIRLGVRHHFSTVEHFALDNGKDGPLAVRTESDGSRCVEGVATHGEGVFKAVGVCKRSCRSRSNDCFVNKMLASRLRSTGGEED